MTRLCLIVLVGAWGCGDETSSGDTSVAAEVDADTSVLTCDPSLRPIVLAHGFLAAGDTWSAQIGRFEANGYCPGFVVPFDWNTLVQGDSAGALDAVIDAVLAKTGATQVDLAGHSAGGGLGYRYLSDSAHAAKVAHYAHVGSNPVPLEEVPSGPAGPSGAPVPTLAIRSDGDTIISTKADIPGATNVNFASADHYEVATSVETFRALYEHFRGVPPTETTPRPASRPLLEGKALTLGENIPVTGWTVEVWDVDGTTGQRTGESPAASYTIGADGAWGPFTATTGARYELFLKGVRAEDRPVHYYLEPVTTDDRAVRLRALPGPESLVGALLAQLPFDDRHVVLIAFSSSRAVIAGRNTLTIGGRALATEALAAAARTAIAFFIFDEGVDQKSAGEAGTFSGLLTVFLTAVDEFITSDSAEPVTLTLDGRALTIPRWPSATGGAVVAMFK